MYGVGRRICAGKELAEANVFAYAATLLATSNMKKLTREDGSVIEPELVLTSPAAM